MKRRKKLDQRGISFWESTSDLLAALLFMLLLIIMLLFLYLKMIPEDDEIDPDPGDTYEEQQEDSSEDNNSSGGGNDSGGGSDEEEYDIDDTEHREDEMKAAVYVKVVDSETGKEIPQSGIRFRLYTGKNNLKVLHDYYPKKVAVKELETTDEGVFYLPEKLYWGNYYLKNMSTISGYMLSPNVEFKVEESHDWSDPIIVTVELSPFKNTIAIRMLDEDTNEAIPKGSFEIVSAEDILAKDGTVRYSEGEVVDELVCDKDGYAISKELYLGNYLVVQKLIPEHYASIEEPVQVNLTELSKNLRADSWQVDDGEETAVQSQEVYAKKTSITLRLKDEYDTSITLADVNFLVTCDEDASFKKNLTTDQSGAFTVTDLKKDATYHFKQLNTLEDYQILDEDYTINVDETGRIDGMAEYQLDAVNRLIRVAVSVKDKLLKKTVPDVSLSLYNSDEQLIHTWSTTEGEEIIKDLTTGKYYIVVDGKQDTRHEFEVTDTGNVQNVEIEIYSTNGILIFAAIGLGVLLVLGLIVFFIVRMLKRKKMNMNKDV